MATYWVDPTATGSNDGSSLANAWTDLASFVSVASSGDICYCANTQTLSSAISISSISGTSSSRITLIGVNSSGVDDGTYFTLDANSTSTYSLQLTSSSYWTFKNIKFTNSTSHLVFVTGTLPTYWNNCEFSNSGSTCVNTTVNQIFKRCYFANNTGDCLSGDESYCTKSIFISSAAAYTSIFEGGFSDNIVHNCNRGLYTPGRGCVVVGNIFDSMSEYGVRPGSYNTVVSNNRFTNCTGSGILCSIFSDMRAIYENNYFYNTGGTDVGGTYSADIFDGGDNRLTGVNSADGYTDQANDNFTLTIGDNGVEVPIPLGSTNETVNIGYITQGIQPLSPAQGGGSLVGGGLVK